MESGEGDEGIMNDELRVMNEWTKKGKPDIAERTVKYSPEIVRLYRVLPKDDVGGMIGKQMLRSGTSIGANVHEAQGAQTKADFNAMMYIRTKRPERRCIG